ncbi:MAG: TonB-dependent receptor [Ignavibacteriae bacterium]|nr:TonB-dependent receptor [Ignavibacteriota bacterium]
MTQDNIKILAFFTLLFLTSQIFGQGNISGIISDSLTNKPLIGANAVLMGTSMGSATDLEGEYKISRVPDGQHKIRISYIGYKPKEFVINIVSGRTLNFDINLSPDIVEGETVVVSAQAAGQVAAINQQLSSNTIVNIVSEEKIQELPDANAAESIGRLPGVSVIRSGGEANKVILRGLSDKFLNVTIDGMKVPPTDATGRGIDLSMISQNSLAGIELYKALTSDKDGDALAGSVNLVTKTAPHNREIRLDLKGGYNDIMNSFKQYDFAVNYGERFFDDFLGVQLNANLESKIRSNESINVNYSVDQSFGGDYFINNFLLQHTDEIRERNGFKVLLDFRTPDDGVIRINNVLGKTKRDYLWFYREFTSNGGGDFDGPAYDFRDREQEIGTFNSSIKGDNNLLGFKLSWGLSFAESEANYPYDYEMIFVEDGGMEASPKIKTNPEQLIDYAVNSYLNASLDWAYFREQNNYDKEKTIFLDISRTYNISKEFSGEFKFGGKYKIKDRSNNQSEKLTPYYLGRWMPYERLPDGTFQLKDFTGTYFENWWLAGGGAIGLNEFFSDLEIRDIYGKYPLSPIIERDRLREWQRINQYGVNSSGSDLPNAQEIWDNPLIKYNDYNITEKVSSGYLMNTLNVSQFLTVITGLRIENESNDYLASFMRGSTGGFPVDPGVIQDTNSTSQQTVWLPNLNILIKPNDFMNIRLAAYKALARPDFNMRLDRYIAGRPAEASSRPQVYVGNIGLKSAQAWNFEINTSFFTNEIGLISISAYYKEIDDMFHMLNNFNTFAVRDEQGVLQDTLIQHFGIKWPSKMGTTPYDLTLPYNSPKPTKVWGFELEHQINFLFLPGFLKNFVLSYNASIVRSETVTYGSQTISYIDSSGLIPLRKSKNILIERVQQLEGMPEFFGNISLGYDLDGFSARISLFHKAKHNVTFSARSDDRVTKPFTRIDLVVKQKITDYLSAFVNVNNLTDVEEGSDLVRRQYDYTLFDQSERYGLTLDFGVTLNF